VTAVTSPDGSAVQLPQGQRPETRARILEAVGDMLSAYGVKRLRIEDVAAAAGVSRQTVSAYFGTRDQLLTTYLELQIAELVSSFERRVLEHDDFAAGLRAEVRTELELLAAYPVLHPPKRDDWVIFVSTSGSNVLRMQACYTGTMLAKLTDAPPALAARAGDVMARMLFSYLTLPPEGSTRDEIASDIAAAVLAVLGSDG